MNESRRTFLKASGITVLGVGGGASLLAARSRGVPQHAAPNATKDKRYALAIDTNKCAREEGCHACVTACHVEHNVPDIRKADGTVDNEEEIKWIWKESVEHTFHDSVNRYSSEELKHREIPVLCNHCDNPPCVRVCPTQATYKREDGPVMMDQHRCIGCRFCVVGCPYGARSFNWSDPRDHFENRKVTNDLYPTRAKGVVEKCTLCADRLARGLEPACVEACPQDAMIFGDLEEPDSEIRKYIESTFTVRRKAELGTRPQVHYKL
jgi:Fe-S-cluster-containing dehydrogenase component